MSWNCSVCNIHVGPRIPLVRHVINRQVPYVKHTQYGPESMLRTEIAAEVTVCHRCKRQLELGTSLKSLREVVQVIRKDKIKQCPEPSARIRCMPEKSQHGNVDVEPAASKVPEPLPVPTDPVPTPVQIGKPLVTGARIVRKNSDGNKSAEIKR